MVDQLAGRVALVTGAAGGIGATYARALADAGASVVIADVDDEGARAVAAELVAAGRPAHGAGLDVRDSGAVADVVASTADRYGSIDIVVNNAGLHLGQYAQPPTMLSDDRWTDLFDVNVVGAVRCIRACVPYFERQGRGVVINQSSASAYRLGTAYSVSKLALIGLTVTMAAELGSHGVRVNAIAPGLVESPATLAELPIHRWQTIVAAQDLPRRGSMDDLVGALLFLASDASSFMTGQTLVVDGGLSTHI